MVVVDIALATICFLGQCHHALIGSDTPRGEFLLVHRFTESAGYGGSVLKFKETENAVYAIHRVWLLRPQERRLERLSSTNPKYRQITKGCINVSPQVYEELVRCCSDSQLVVR